jgi:transcriptional regulator with XRE-family HTH domain
MLEIGEVLRGKMEILRREDGERLGRLRTGHSLTQQALADRFGIKQILIADYQSARLRMHAERVVRFAQALGISTDDLLGTAETKPLSEGRLSLKVVLRLSKIESLPASKQRALLQTIDAFLKAENA